LRISIILFWLANLLSVHVSAQEVNNQALDSQPKHLVIVTGDYSPLIDSSKADYGQVSKLVSDAFAEVGISVSFRFFPWARAIRLARIGKEAAVMYYGKTDDRALDFYFSAPLFREDWLLFHKQGVQFSWRHLEDLSDFRFGATLSYTYTERFHQLADSNVLKVHWVGSDEQNWKMLMRDRVDIVAFPIVGWNQLNTLYQNQANQTFTTHEKPLSSQLNYLLFSKNHKHSEYFLAKFNEGFNMLKSKSVLTDYLPDYIDQQWPEPDTH